MFRNILLEKRNRIAVLTVNRPKVLNALNRETYQEIFCAVQDIQQDDGVDVVILTGAGEKSFIAGGDIAQMRDLSPMESRAMTLDSQAAANALEDLPQPVIAAVNGYALGGGCELAMACDIRIASAKASFGQPEVGLGIIPGCGGTQRLPRLIGEGRAKYYCMTGELISADEALHIGLVSKVTAPEALMAEAIHVAETIQNKSPVAVRMVKKSIRRGMDMDLKNAIAWDAEAQTVCFAADDRKEGMDAFLEKRPARFQEK